jgi:hypothetical protein
MSRSLRAFVAHRPEVLESRSSAASPTDTPSPPYPVLWRVWQYLASFWPSAFHQSDLPKSIHTVYGLTLTKSRHHESYEVQLTTAKATGTGRGNEGQKYHYRIFPDWGTSFFWKNPKFLVGRPGSSAIDDEDIESRYPLLAPYFFAWRGMYEDAFYEQEIHLGSKAEVFSGVEVRVAWFVEGFLMACWLALQREVGSVEFLSGDKIYTVDKATVDEELKKFLEAMNTLLGET